MRQVIVAPKRLQLMGAIFACMLFLLTAVSALANSDITSGPNIGLNADNQMEMTFETQQPGMSHIEYGPTEEYGQETRTFVALDRRHRHILEDLMVDTVYYYRIHLSDWIGGSSIAMEGTFVTPGLEAPSGVRARGHDEEVRITWQRVFGATEYKVMRSLQPGGPYELVGTTEDLIFADKGLENFVDYYYVVHAVTIDGKESEASEEVVGTPTPVHPDLVAGYSFEDDSDDVIVADRSLNGHHGQLMRGAEFVPGRGGQVVRLNGGYIEVPSSPDFNFGSEFTVTVWVNLDTTSANQKIVGRTNTTNGWVLGFEHAIYPEVWDSRGVLHQSQGQGSMEAGVWNQLAITWKQNDYLIAYINGKEVVRVPTDDYPMGDNANSPLRIGVAPWDLNAFQMQGEVDEVNIYKRALSAEEILLLYEDEALF